MLDKHNRSYGLPYLSMYTSTSIYIFENVCLFVCLFAVNAKTTERIDNYEELLGECPLWLKIARLSALGMIS